MIDLKKIAGIYRTSLDESYEPGADDSGKLWYYEIKGARGTVFVQGENELGVFTDRPITANKLRAIPGLRPLQTGDREVSFRFHPDLLDQVAAIIKPKRRRVLSEEHRAVLATTGARTRFSKHGSGDRFEHPGTHAEDQPV